MSSTYGWLWGSKGQATRTGGRDGIHAKLQTWDGRIYIHLKPDGTVSIRTEGKIRLVDESGYSLRGLQAGIHE